MKKYEKTTEEIAKELSITPNRIWKYISAKEVIDNSPLRSEEVRDYTTFQLIHAMPKKEWKDAVDYVMKKIFLQEILRR